MISNLANIRKHKYLLLIITINFILLAFSIYYIVTMGSSHSRTNAENVYALKFSPDSKLLTSIGSDGISTWNIPDLKQVQNFGFFGETYYYLTALSPDQQTVFTKNPKGLIQAWRFADKKLLYSFQSYPDTFLEVKFNSDGSLFSVGGRNSPSGELSTQIRKVSDGQLVRVIDSTSQITFSSDGNLIASPGDLNTPIKLWQMKDGALLRTFSMSRLILTPGVLVFSPDSKYLAASSAYNTAEADIQLWRVSDGVLLYTIKETPDLAGSIAFSPDGQILAIGYETNGDPEFRELHNTAIELRQVSDGKLFKRLVGHKKDILSLTFSPDGNYLASSSRDGTIRLWSLK